MLARARSTPRALDAAHKRGSQFGAAAPRRPYAGRLNTRSQCVSRSRIDGITTTRVLCERHACLSRRCRQTDFRQRCRRVSTLALALALCAARHSQQYAVRGQGRACSPLPVRAGRSRSRRAPVARYTHETTACRTRPALIVTLYVYHEADAARAASARREYAILGMDRGRGTLAVYARARRRCRA